MRVLEIKDVKEQPGGDELGHFPYYIIGRMLRDGPSMVEADASFHYAQPIEFVLRHQSGEKELIASVPTRGEFRSIMARFAVFCQLQDIYAGQVLFASEYEREGRLRMHRFSLFFCNEPAMGIWLRLYLYSIESLWPLNQVRS
jgi:hypothetical protein